jgi:pimeloyl-ACP methyl ester carboxylesterase
VVETQLTLPRSPLAPGRSPARIRVREAGRGAPLVLLHGNWGYEVYPYDRQIAALGGRRRFIVPDRTGYGGSDPIDVQLDGFLQRAAEETLALLDAMDIERAALWGHSDGAIIALLVALKAPARVDLVIGEATHFWRRKPRSQAFFETMRDAPERLGARAVEALQRDHGPRWRALISTNGAAWLRIGADAKSDDADLYDGRLPELAVPALFVHGGRDPRTEPGELEALCAAAPAARLALIAEAGHSPHVAPSSADETTRLVAEFLR